MRQVFNKAQAMRMGITEDALKWKVKTGELQRIKRNAYVLGSDRISGLERAVAEIVTSNGAATGHLAAVLYNFDGAYLKAPFEVTRDEPDEYYIARGYACVAPIKALMSWATCVDDDKWEQAFEYALRKRLVTFDEMSEAAKARRKGNVLIRRVLKRRGNVPFTESPLETMAVQLIRNRTSLPDPERQVTIWDGRRHVARVDLAWPSVGLFVELDGEGHKDEPVYDASRETDVVATTGWLCARFSWTEIHKAKANTARRFENVYGQAISRPMIKPLPPRTKFGLQY